MILMNMNYYSEEELNELGFRSLGKDVKISKKASIFDTEKIEVGDHTRIDDFCIISGQIIFGNYNHITPMCLVAGGEPGIFFSDFCTLAYGVKIFSQSDDYGGETLVNSLIPKKYKSEKKESVFLGKHVVVGANSVVFPGVRLAEGSSVGAMTLVTKNTDPWGIYLGIPARRVKERKKDLLKLETQFLKESK